MIIGVVKETFPGERRVALVPEALPRLTEAGFEIQIEVGAGVAAGFSDEMYQERGAKLISERADVINSVDALLQVRGLGANPEEGASDLELFRKGQIVIGLLDPLSAPEVMEKAASRELTTFALELMPRITRAQSMDVLSAMATIAGYKAVLLAAEALPKMFPMLMTAAGTVTPAHVFIVGVGVAGLQAIATARRLGAVVQAYDIRPAVKEQVQSVGAEFVELEIDAESAETKGGYAREMDEEFYRKQREMMSRVLAENHVVITTAAVPGKKAPTLVTSEMVEGMTPGSVIVDLAAERGGNCELTRPGETVVEHGVTIIGPVNIPSTVPYDASRMFARNISSFLLHVFKDGESQFDPEDEIARETIVTREGQILRPEVQQALE
ncbi:Re/Si-specific NAD(P)(+) transhydrogenase subunit alpha [Candidatus Poribacteria bacterium]